MNDIWYDCSLCYVFSPFMKGGRGDFLEPHHAYL